MSLYLQLWLLLGGAVMSLVLLFVKPRTGAAMTAATVLMALRVLEITT